MAVEIEHKYLVVNDSYRSMATGSCRLAQGYVCREPERTVRVRTGDDKGWLTIKGTTVGDTRMEFEYEIGLKDAEQLLELCVGRIVRKTRYFVPFDGRVWEVDEYEGELAPLVVAEIELPDSGCKYQLPPFVGANVTGDPRYYNSNL